MIKGIIFDCDGTLVDSEHLFNRALSLKLAERGVNLSANQLVARFRGVKFADVLASIEQEFKVKLDDGFVAQYRALVETFFKQDLKACDGVAQTLAQIDLPMSVATNGPLAKMKIAMQVTGLSDFFNERLFSAYDVDCWKPDPGLFLHVADAMNLSAQECLVVEDSVVGIDGAIAANMNAVLYDPHGVHSNYYASLDSSQRASVAKVSHFSEVLNCLKDLNQLAIQTN